MLHKCVVGGCPNRSDTVIHYMLPEDPERRSLWLKFIEDSRGDGEDASSSCRVCGDHFSEENYFKMDLGYCTCMILSVDAVPTVQTVYPSPEPEREMTLQVRNSFSLLYVNYTIYYILYNYM